MAFQTDDFLVVRFRTFEFSQGSKDRNRLILDQNRKKREIQTLDNRLSVIYRSELIYETRTDSFRVKIDRTKNRTESDQGQIF